MQETEFNTLVEETFNKIEESIDALDKDIDPELNNDILTLTFPNHARIIINRQLSAKQLWIATPKQGYHLDYIDGKWVCCKHKQTLVEILSDACSQQLNEKVNLKAL